MRITLRHLIIPFILCLFLLSAETSFGRSSRSGHDFPIIATVHKRSPAGAKNIVSKRAETIVAVLDTRAKQNLSARQYSDTPRLRKITAQSAVVMDGEDSGFLYAKSPDQPRQPASTIKVLTGLVAMEALADEARIPVSRRAAGMPRSKIYLDQRKSYRADDLINAVLLASANDASVALAEKVAGSELKFANLMSRKAEELGAGNTVCRTASGLTARGQQTTARDLAVIFREAMKNDEFAERIGRVKIKTKEGRTLRNHNKALWRITGAEGGKTGYTRAAKQTYVGQFQRGDDTILVAIMGSKTLWKDVDRLVEYGFAKKKQLRLAGRDSKRSRDDVALKSSHGSPLKSSDRKTYIVLSDNKKIAKL